MKIIQDICYLTVGDKIKLRSSNEGGEIRKVINADLAKIEFFEDTREVNVLQVNPFSSLSSQSFKRVQYYTEHKRKSKTIKKNYSKLGTNVIDLHAEVLFPDHHRTMSNENIIQQKLSHLNNFLDQLIVSDFSDGKIIHGKGTGSLRSQVIDVLESKYKIYNLDTDDMGFTKFRL